MRIAVLILLLAISAFAESVIPRHYIFDYSYRGAYTNCFTRIEINGGMIDSNTIPISAFSTDALSYFQSTSGTNGANGANGLNGATGAQGIQGVAGTNGTNGAVGATGSQGAQGVAGVNGTNGAQGIQGLNGTNAATGLVTNQFTTNTAIAITQFQPASAPLTNLAALNGSGLTNLPYAFSFSSTNGYWSAAASGVQVGATNWTFVFTNISGLTATLLPAQTNQFLVTIAAGVTNGLMRTNSSGGLWANTVTASNGIATFATNSTLVSTSTTISNSQPVAMQVWLTAATGLSMTNSYGTNVLRGQAVAALTSFILQPRAQLVGSSIICVGTNGL